MQERVALTPRPRSPEVGAWINELSIPRITFTIFLGGHESAKDAQGIEPYFRQCDLYIPELMGWNQEDLEVMNALSEGKLTPVEAAANPKIDPYRQQIKEMVYDSHRPIALIDYDEDDEMVEECRRDVRHLCGIPSYWLLVRDFREFVDGVKKVMKDVSEDEVEREKNMLSNLEPTITQVVENNPDLKKRAQEKGQLNVLLSLGAAHTAVTHALRRKGHAVYSIFSHKPFQYPYIAEGIRRYNFEKEVDDNLAARVLAESLVNDVFDRQLSKAFPETYPRCKFVRQVVSLLSYKDIEDIFNSRPRGKIDREKSRQVFRQALRNKIPDGAQVSYFFTEAKENI